MTQQHQQSKQPEKWRPNANTVFFVQSEENAGKSARRLIEREFGRAVVGQDGKQRPHRVVSQFDPRNLRESSHIVVVYEDPNALFDDGTMLRKRKKGARGEEPPVRVSTPIACAELWVEPKGDEFDGGVDAGKLGNEIVRRCMRDGHPVVRVQYVDRDGQQSMHLWQA